MNKMIGISLLLVFWARTPVLAQYPGLSGTWERSENVEEGTRKKRLRFSTDGTFSLKEIFSGDLDALFGDFKGGEEEGYTFTVGKGTSSATLAGTYEMDGDRLIWTGVRLTEFLVNDKGVREFFAVLADQFVVQFVEEKDPDLPEEGRQALKTLFVVQALVAFEEGVEEPTGAVFTFSLEGDSLVLTNQGGKVEQWRRVPDGTAVSTVTWAQVKTRPR